MTCWARGLCRESLGGKAMSMKDRELYKTQAYVVQQSLVVPERRWVRIEVCVRPSACSDPGCMDLTCWKGFVNFGPGFARRLRRAQRKAYARARRHQRELDAARRITGEFGRVTDG